MKKSSYFFLVLLFGALCLNAVAADTPSPTGKPGPQKSGFYDFWQIPFDGPSGVGTIPQTADCLIGQSTQPAIYAGNSLLDCDGETPHNETTIAVDPNNPAHAVGGFHSYRLFFNGATVVERVAAAASSTFDGGLTWHEVIPPVTPYQFTGDPGLAFDRNSKLYYSNIADHEGPGGNFTGPSVVVASSSDGGVTWTNPVTAARGQTAVNKGGTDSGPNIFNDKPFLAVDTGAASSFQNRVYVSWTRFAQVVNNKKLFFNAPINIVASDDGQHWSQPMAISGFSPFCSFAYFGAPNECDENQDSYPAVASNGKVYVSFENFNTPAANQILLVSSTDGGQTWSAPSQATFVNENYPSNVDGRATLTGCQLRYSVKANTAVDPSDPTGNTVYVAFADNRNGSASATNTDVFLAKSTDGGNTWLPLIPVDTSANDQFYPWVAVASNGDVSVGYMDREVATGAVQSQCKYGFSVTKLDSAGNLLNKTEVDTGISNLSNSRWFGINSRFIGDYNGVAIGSDGTTWSLWTDQRAPVAGSTRTGQHAVAAKN